MDPIIKEKFDKLRAYYKDEDSQSMLDDAEKRLRDSIKNQKISEMEVIIGICDAGKKVIEDLNFILLNAETLTEKERDRLIERRKSHEFYIDRLSGEYYQKRIDAIEKFLDSRIKITGDINP